MLYNTMNAYFIWQLLATGSASVILLCFGVINLYKGGFEKPYIYKTAALFSASLTAVSLFISVTAYSLPLLYVASVSALLFCALALVLFIAAVISYRKKALSFFTQGINFDDFIDVFGDEYVIIDDYGSDIACSKPQFEKVILENFSTNSLFIVEDKQYFVRTSDIMKNSKKIGRVFLMSDISEKQQIANQISLFNAELKKLNAELERDAAIDSSILFHRERDKLSAEIEKLIGENISGILSFIDKIEFEKEQSKQSENIVHISSQLRNLLADIRKAVNKEN